MADMFILLRSLALFCLLFYSGLAQARFAIQPSAENNIKTKNYSAQGIRRFPATLNSLTTPAEILIIARQEGERGHGRDMSREQRRERFDALPAEQRQRIKARRQRFESLPPEERQRLREARKKFRQLPEAEREKLKQKWHNLSPQERQRAIDQRRKGRP